MTTLHAHRDPPPNTATASFLGRLFKPRTKPSDPIGRTPAVDPAIVETTMSMSGWVSWEMVHFISEIASERKQT